MKKFLLFLICCAMCLTVISCADSSEQSQNDDLPHEYVELARLHPDYNFYAPPSYQHVLANPDGTPDPLPGSLPSGTTAEGVTMTTAPSAKLKFVSIDFVLTKEGEDTYFEYDPLLRLERQDADGSWTRLYHYDVDAGAPVTVNNTAETGMATLSIYREDVISPITPGKYRAVAFVGEDLTHVYAEFTIAE